MRMKYENARAGRSYKNRAWGLGTTLIAAALLLPAVNAQTQYRTVIDHELGSMFQHPDGFSWDDYGIFDGSPESLDPNAIRVFFGHFNQFAPEENLAERAFPFAQFQAYDAQQVAEGKTSLFVWATYQGKKRQVLYSWSLGLVNNKPTTPTNQWQYLVNFQDPRFIHFWLNQYIEKLMSTYQKWLEFGPNLWFQLDQCAYEYSTYGVLDNNNNFVPVTFDEPYPQNQAQFETAIETFFTQVETVLAPNIRLITNIGSQANPSHFPQLWANVPGAMTENLASSNTARTSWYEQNFQYYPWLASQNRLTLMRSEIPSNESGGLLTSFAIYSLLKGINSFFAPGDQNANSTEAWEPWAAQLGAPTGTMQASAASSEGAGYRLFSRTFENGIVYLNWTGTTQTVQLSPSTTYYNSAGTELTSHSISIADGIGTYVTTVPHALAEPHITPRYGYTAEGPLSITMTSSVSGAVIRYTLDGSTPSTSSPQYTGPVKISNSAVVSARAFSGSASSLTARASYTITSTPVSVDLVLTSDTGMSGTYYPVVVLSAIPTSTVEVFYTVQNGTPSNGSYTFLPGMKYGVLPITTDSKGITTITLTGATGARLGSQPSLEYTILP